MDKATGTNPIDVMNDKTNKISLSTSPPVQNYLYSTSPTATQSGFGLRPQSRRQSLSYRQLKPFDTADIKILLLENVNQTALDAFDGQNYQVKFHKSSLPEDELIEAIRDVHVIGIRSKTKLSQKVLQHAKNLLVIGCFCIGTNQVDLEYAADRGIAVFNSPFSNSRSVAELVIAYVISLARQLGDRSSELHNGVWNKVSNKCWEIRGKTLGIVGYGHIGSQLSVLAEAFGMSVIYYDVVPLMALGMSKQMNTLEELLARSDFVTLHVPELPETKCMISTPQFNVMKQGSYIINASRGSVIDIPALIEARKSGRIAGAAIDVYPHEPSGNGPHFNKQLNSWTEDLVALPNMILTPHIGGSTEEAQSMIGVEVSDAIIRYVNEGYTISSVNFPEVALRGLTQEENHVRILLVHKNVPGVLREVNEIFKDNNIRAQFSDSRGDIAYLMADISNVTGDDIQRLNSRLQVADFTIRVRLLY